MNRERVRFRPLFFSSLSRFLLRHFPLELTVVDGTDSRTLWITSCNMSAFASNIADAVRSVVVRASGAQFAAIASGASSFESDPPTNFLNTGTERGGSKSSCALAATAAELTAAPCSGSACERWSEAERGGDEAIKDVIIQRHVCVRARVCGLFPCARARVHLLQWRHVEHCSERTKNSTTQRRRSSMQL